MNFNFPLQIAPDVPVPSQPSPQRQAMERLFLDVAGADGEVDWVELKRILDHSFRDGEYFGISNRVYLR